MIRRPPRSTLDRSSAASDVYKRQALTYAWAAPRLGHAVALLGAALMAVSFWPLAAGREALRAGMLPFFMAVSYTHLRAHETVLDLVCRLLLGKKKR